jgi:hypothetical protein
MDLPWFILILHFFTQSLILLMVAWSSIEAITQSSCVAKIAVSPVKVAVVVLSDVGRSLVWIIYGMRPKTLPCGMPASVFLKFVILSLNFTWKSLYPVNMILIFLSYFEREAWVSDFIKRLCDVQEGCRAVLFFFFLPKVPLIIFVIQCTCSVVECFCQSPNWWSRRIRFSSSVGRNLLSIAFSKILLIIGSRLIGL